jgi:hypothetical protein
MYRPSFPIIILDYRRFSVSVILCHHIIFHILKERDLHVDFQIMKFRLIICATLSVIGFRMAGSCWHCYCVMHKQTAETCRERPRYGAQETSRVWSTYKDKHNDGFYLFLKQILGGNFMKNSILAWELLKRKFLVKLHVHEYSMLIVCSILNRVLRWSIEVKQSDGRALWKKT